MQSADAMKDADDEIMSQTTAALVLTLLCSLSGVACAMMVALIIAAGK